MTAPAAQKAAAVSTDVKREKVSKSDLAVLEREAIRVLPSHIGADKFVRVVTTALHSNTDLANADRASLFQAAMKCALDGLMPDGKEAAFVVFKTKDRMTGRYVQKVQYLPMIGGILKKVRQSGELGSLVCNVVCEGDDFRHWVDDAGEHITHETNIEAEGRKVKAAYAIVTTKDGGKYHEVMTLAQIQEVRSTSRAKDDGPWVSWFGEMARKTVLRRLSKRLPMSTDLQRTIQRDDEMYTVKSRTERSGVDAARNVLGMLPDPVDAPSGGQVIDQDEPPPRTEPQFTDDTALAEIAAATSEDQLKERWVEIANDYFETGRELPVKLQGAYGDRLETLKQKVKTDAAP